MRTPPLPFCLTLLLASGGCLTSGIVHLGGSPALAQTLPPQGVPNTTGPSTPDGPIAGSTSPSGAGSSTGAPAAASTSGTGSTSTTTSIDTIPSAPPQTSSPVSPAPGGSPSGTAAAQSPAAVSTPNTGAVQPPVTPLPAGPAGSSLEQSKSLDPNTIYLINGDLLRLSGEDTAVVTGNVEVRYRDYTLYADRATVNTDTGRVDFDGNVRVISSRDKTRIAATDPKTHLVLDSRKNSYSVAGPQHAVIDQDLFAGSGLLLPLRVDSNDATSINGILDARQGGFTTCDFLHPHYLIGVRSLTVIPGKRLIARHAILYRRGRRLAELSYLVVPLDNRYSRASYLPLVGEDSAEGTFVKFSIPYALTAAALGILRLDYMSAIGTGTGFDQSYPAHGPGGNGTLTLYRLDDRETGLRELTGSLTHQQTVGNFKVNFNTQYENNSYESAVGASTNLNGSLNVIGTEKYGTTLFTSNLTRSDYGVGGTSNLTASLNQLLKLGGLNTLGVKMNYSGAENFNQGTAGAAYLTPPTVPGSSTAPSTTTAAGVPTSDQQRATLSSNINLHLQPNGLIMDLQTDLFSTLKNTTGNSLNILSGLQRRPELLLTTTGRGDDPLDEIAHLVRGSQIQLGFGQYVEPHFDAALGKTAPFSNDRLYFSYDGGNQVRHTGDFTLTSDSSYQQAFYQDGGAQYLLDGHYGSAYARGPLTLGANYSTLRAYGFTPFLFDRPGDYNNANFTAGYSPNRAVTVSAVTAYNFLQDRGVYENENGKQILVEPALPWQNLIAVLSVHPNPLLNDQLQGAYDPNHGTLFDVTNTFYAANRAGFGFRSAFDYLPQHGRFGAVNGALDLPIILDQREQAGYKVQAIAGYNGETNKFTYQGVALTRSWHDFELTATYQNSPYSFGTQNNTFTFTFHLKALPGYQPFGVGSAGQSLTSGVGTVY